MKLVSNLITALMRVRLVNAVAKQGKDSATLSAYTLVGGLMPVWGGIVVLLLYSRDIAVSQFSNNGEFALYSAAVLAPSFYLIVKDYDTSRFLYRPFFAGICGLGLLLSGILFAGVTAVNTGLKAITVDQLFLRRITIGLFAVSIVLSFLVESLDKERIFKDLFKAQQSRFKDFEKKFDETEN